MNPRNETKPNHEPENEVFGTAELPAQYREACLLAEQGRYDEARKFYGGLIDGATEPRLRALVANDLAVLAAIEGRVGEALQGWGKAIDADQTFLPARLNRDLINAELALGRTGGPVAEPVLAPQRTPVSEPDDPEGPVRVAILSFLFNWPSTGGGNIHTVELAKFLASAGYEVRHMLARYADWQIGRVDDELPVDSQALEFDEANWNVPTIQARFRKAVDAFAPEHVLITDAWNMKPILAEAVRGYPYLFRFQAQECLCPLNNLRLLLGGPGEFAQCPRNQLATPDICRRCVAERGERSGPLHQAERALAGVGTPEYDQKLRRALEEAQAVLALNPLTAALLEPYARRVCVVPWGMDPARFPWPPPEVSDGEGGSPEAGSKSGPTLSTLRPSEFGVPATPSSGPSGHLPPRGGKARLFMAAVAGELMKGFHVAHEACRLLRQTRSDFELVVTFDPPGQIDEFTRSVGWCSQDDLPQHYRDADICLVPTIAQEGLSRTSVEAMASGIPVIASRIGGLPFTVSDGTTGLLFEPGDAADLARKIARLLDDPALRRRMGLAGRQRFEDEFTWQTVIERYYRPLLARRVRTPAARNESL